MIIEAPTGHELQKLLLVGQIDSKNFDLRVGVFGRDLIFQRFDGRKLQPYGPPDILRLDAL